MQKADVVMADAEVQQTGASSSSRDTPMTPDLLEEWRTKLFNLYMEHASEQVHKIPGILEKYGHSLDTLEMRTRALSGSTQRRALVECLRRWPGAGKPRRSMPCNRQRMNRPMSQRP